MVIGFQKSIKQLIFWDFRILLVAVMMTQMKDQTSYARHWTWISGKLRDRNKMIGLSSLMATRIDEFNIYYRPELLLTREGENSLLSSDFLPLPSPGDLFAVGKYRIRICTLCLMVGKLTKCEVKLRLIHIALTNQTTLLLCFRSCIHFRGNL